MAALEGCLLEPDERDSRVQCGSVCYTPESSTVSVCQLETALGTDALRIPWTRWKGYAFPPFVLISKVLRKV